MITYAAALIGLISTFISLSNGFSASRGNLDL